MATAEQVSVAEGGPIPLCLPDLREVHQAEFRASIDGHVADYRRTMTTEYRQDCAVSAIVISAGIAAVEMGVHDSKVQLAVAIASLGGAAVALRKMYKRDMADVEAATARKRSSLESEM